MNLCVNREEPSNTARARTITSSLQSYQSNDLFCHSFLLYICINCSGIVFLFLFSCYSLLIYFRKVRSLFTVILALEWQLLNLNLIGFLQRAQFPLLCYVTMQNTSSANIEALSFLKSLTWTVKMGLAWSSYKSKRKEKKDYKRYVKFYAS